MDVTARELREGNIRDALRGYNHDDVDELLERAAVTVDNLQARIAQLTQRIGEIESQASRGRETEEQLSRTLLIAQRTADEIVEEARESARKVVEEAESKASTVIAEAERTAKDEIEAEARRLESEVLQLAATREALDQDVARLTTFAEDLGARLREALEAQIAALESREVDLSGRPQLTPVDLPAPEEAIAEGRRAAQVPESPGSEPSEAGVVDEGLETARLASVEVDEAEPVAREPRPHEPVAGEALEDPIAVQPRDPPEPDPLEPDPAVWEGRGSERLEEARSERERADEQPPERAPTHHSPLLDERFGLGPARPIESRGKGFDTGDVLEGEILDDETFFASLRDAVRDESPLGPRDEELGPPETHGDLFDQEESEAEADEDQGRGLFRRRR